MSSIHVTTDLLAEPWTDITDPPFGKVERIGYVPTKQGPPNVAMLIRLEDGTPIVAMLELALYVKASTVLQKMWVQS